MDADRDRWDERYADAERAIPAAPDVIDRWPELDAVLPSSGLAVDLACGIGAQSLWLAQRGCEVLSLDVSPAAIELVDAAASDHGLADRIDARVFDTDDGLPDDITDAAVIVCQRYRAPQLYAELVERLAPGGMLCLTVLSAVGLDGEPGPFHAAPGELGDAFGLMPNAEVIHVAEGGGLACVVVSRRFR